MASFDTSIITTARIEASSGSPPALHTRDSNTSQVRHSRVHKSRSRVSRACDRCKGKKIRCSGKRPCTLCVNQDAVCQFTAKYTRGRVPPIEDAEDMDSSAIVASESADDQFPGTPCSRAASEDHAQESILAVPGLEQENIGNASRVHSSRNSPEPSQTDLEGHYVGPSSGASFLLRAQKRLHRIVSLSRNSSIFTFGDAPLPTSDTSFLILPTLVRAEALVERYFDFAVPTHRFFHRSTVESWLAEMYNGHGFVREKGATSGKKAVLFMVFAQAEEYMPISRGENSDQSARYFDAAEHELRSETGEIRLTSIQARLAQCFYLLSKSRINHCWSLFGTTAHLALALGIHRRKREDTTSKVDMIDAECRKRVFWAAYTLDNYLSTALGRPRTFHNDDIDQELPCLVDDSELTTNGITPSSRRSQSIMFAPIQHIKLAQIINRVLRDIYNIRPVREEDRIRLTRQYSTELSDWQNKNAHFLDADPFLMDPLFRRQSNVLRLAHAHARILVHRPSLLKNFAELSYYNRTVDTQTKTKEGVSECLEAAMTIARIVDELYNHGQIYRAFWFTHYYAFCAVVVLYVYTIQRRRDPQSTWQEYFTAATRCQEQIHNLRGQGNSLALRYSVVLEELRIEASQQMVDAIGGTHTNHISNSNILNTEGSNHMAVHPTLSNDRINDRNHHESTGLVHLETEINNGETSRRMRYAPGVDMPHVVQPGLEPQYSNELMGYNPSGPAACYDMEGMNFEAQMAGVTPENIMDSWTGWGDFDNLVASGIVGLGAPRFSDVPQMSISRF